ncbi:MAG: ribonuclease E inhibitor RraB [Flavobacterium sp.]|uniref:ribonuclease E inhibitor RraB n=1 Tax=Flavobacterium sp. TaxID=239 RepID=UPI00121C7EB6|nr:ribonuclease E inhibitor RraB [Flavobacterium sp.]RZJ64412.1 MAG: ribonuclease E inhibitor RraB [Flavobacterium sp.]
MYKLSISFLILISISCRQNDTAKFDINQIEANEKTLNTLKEASEKFEVKRDIFHWIYFKDENNLQEFLREVKTNGYSVVKTNEIDDEFPFQLQIKINDYISKEIMDQQVLYLENLAKKYSGDYDGWETSVES